MEWKVELSAADWLKGIYEEVPLEAPEAKRVKVSEIHEEHEEHLKLKLSSHSVSQIVKRAFPVPKARRLQSHVKSTVLECSDGSFHLIYTSTSRKL